MNTHPLKKWREKQGLPQGEFAKRICVSRWMVNRIECGERFPGRETIARIIDVTGGEVDAAQLMGLSQPTPPG